MIIKNIYTNKEIKLYKAKRPKMKTIFGRSWDSFNIILDGKTVNAYLDFTWGRWVYLEIDKQWYKGKVEDFYYALNKKFYTNKNKFIRK